MNLKLQFSPAQSSTFQETASLSHDDDEEAAHDPDDGFSNDDDDEDYSVSSMGLYHAEQRTRHIFRYEARAMQWARLLFVSSLMVTGILASIASFMYLRQREYHDFSHDSSTTHQQLIWQLQERAATSRRSLQAWSYQVAQYAADTGATWPEVTLPDIDRRSKLVSQQSGATLLVHAPVITNATRKSWESYSVQQGGWMTASIPEHATMHSYSIRSKNSTSNSSNDNAVNHTTTNGFAVEYLPHSIFNDQGKTSGPGPFLPVWQVRTKS
jgi:hypothetical protein